MFFKNSFVTKVWDNWDNWDKKPELIYARKSGRSGSYAIILSIKDDKLGEPWVKYRLFDMNPFNNSSLEGSMPLKGFNEIYKPVSLK